MNSHRVFVSYRHVKPDEDLASAIVTYLESRGISVFFDKYIQSGQLWGQEIEDRIRSASAFVALLSASSILSPMVEEEIRIAYKLMLEGKILIIPLRVNYTDDLPYSIGAYLNRIQQINWSPSKPFENICVEILGTLTSELLYNPTNYSDPLLPANSESTAIRQEQDFILKPPLPAADISAVLTGTIPLDSSFYIRRSADAEIEKILEGTGKTIVVRGTRQSGKSSLVLRAISWAKKNGYESVYLDLENADGRNLLTLKSLLQNLAYWIYRYLKTTKKPVEVWDDDLGDKASFATFLETEVLEKIDDPVLLCIDEVDLIFGQPYRNDFFAAIRNWHNRRADYYPWTKLSIIIVHSTDPELWIDDLAQSPFNVGSRLHLENFSLGETEELNARYNAPLKNDRDVLNLWQLVGGHPFLIQQSLYTLVSTTSNLEQLLSTASQNEGPFGAHLRHNLRLLHNNPALKESLKEVMDTGRCSSEMNFQRLLGTGLITADSRQSIRMSCRIYQEYFRRHL